MLIREAFLRGISTRQVGRVVATITGEGVSAQTVSQLIRSLDEAVQQFHPAPLGDDWAYLFLDGISLRVRRPCGRQRVQMLVAYGVRGDGTRQLLGFLRSQGESQAAWEGLLQDLYRRGLQGKKLQLIVTDGCAGLAAAIETVYPRAPHQRCWVHKMRNILQKVRRRDYDAVKADAQAIYRADSRRQAEAAFRAFRRRWQAVYGPTVRQLERDLPELLSFFSFPRHLWRKLRTTNIIERCFVEVRRRTRPMVCFVNVKSGPHHLLHLPALQPGMENPHPLCIYTSSLTSSSDELRILFAALWAIEEHPGREVVTEIYESMLLSRGDEQHVSRAKRGFFPFAQETPVSGGDDVNLVPRMGNLTVSAARRIQLHGKRTMPEQLDRALAVWARKPVQPRQDLQIAFHNAAFNFHEADAPWPSSTLAFGFHTPMMMPIRMQPTSG